MKKILLVFGTRPEAIKMAPLLLEFLKYKNIFDTKVCVTGQHREMLDQVLDIFDIVPDYDLNIMKSGQDLYDITARVLLEIKPILTEFKPDLLLVHGDTSTSTSAALAAFYQQIPVGHVEAGLRTNNIYSPWPEEMNRQITGRLASFHFTPTKLSKNNLLKENIKAEHILVTGNTVIDALHFALNKIHTNIKLRNQLEKSILRLYPNLHLLNNERKLILITGHRRENLGKGFEQIFKALRIIAEKNQNFDLVYPVHLNPQIQKQVKSMLGSINNIFLIEPLEYLPFIYLMEKSYLLLTDSGGIQEEAPSLAKPVLVMRDTTERPEAVEAGTVLLVGTDTEKIINTVEKLINDKSFYQKMAFTHNPYGDGKSSKKIVQFLKKQYLEL